MSYGFNPNSIHHRTMNPQENLSNQGIGITSKLVFAVSCIALVCFGNYYEAIGEALGSEDQSLIGGLLILGTCVITGINAFSSKTNRVYTNTYPPRRPLPGLFQTRVPPNPPRRAHSAPTNRFSNNSRPLDGDQGTRGGPLPQAAFQRGATPSNPARTPLGSRPNRFSTSSRLNGTAHGPAPQAASQTHHNR